MHANGDKDWYFHGIQHREDGPAFEASNGYREWWINGEELTEDEFNSYLAKKSSMNYYNPICKKRRPRCRARSKL